MSDEAKIQNSKLTKEQKKLIYDSLATNIIRFQEYRLDLDTIKPDGAILFEYLCYNSYKLFMEDRTSDGYFYHSYERIKQEYGVGKDRMRVIIGYLKEKGIVETKVCGFPKNTHYRIRFDNLASVDVLSNLFRTTPARTKQIAAHYAEIAKVVKLRIETTQETLEKHYPFEDSWFKHLKKIYYAERQRFNKTVSAESAIRKIQPNPREETYRNIGAYAQLVYFDLEGERHPKPETDRRIENLSNGFRLYCAMLFLYSCAESSTNAALLSLAEENEECVTWIVNYASGVRDPIAYFFAKHEGNLNWILASFVDAAEHIDFTTGYFLN